MSWVSHQVPYIRNFVDGFGFLANKSFGFGTRLDGVVQNGHQFRQDDLSAPIGCVVGNEGFGWIVEPITKVIFTICDKEF